MIVKKIAVLKGRLENGVTPAMATPIGENGRFSPQSIPPLVNFLHEAGVKGLFVGGTTGEGLLFSVDERKQLHEAAMDAADGLPILLHVGADRMDDALVLTTHAATLNPAAIVAITPTFFGMDDDALFDYFVAIAQAAPEVPLLLYDIPHMAGNGISISLFERLAEAVPSLAGAKTSRPDAQAIRRLIDAAPPEMIILAGNEAIALGSLALGANGMISGLATAVPEPFVTLTQQFADGDIAAAQETQKLINRLLALTPAKRRLGMIKSILNDRGIDVGTVVPPRAMPETAVWPQMEQLLRKSLSADYAD